MYVCVRVYMWDTCLWMWILDKAKSMRFTTLMATSMTTCALRAGACITPMNTHIHIHTQTHTHMYSESGISGKAQKSQLHFNLKSESVEFNWPFKLDDMSAKRAITSETPTNVAPNNVCIILVAASKMWQCGNVTESQCGNCVRQNPNGLNEDEDDWLSS